MPLEVLEDAARRKKDEAAAKAAELADTVAARPEGRKASAFTADVARRVAQVPVITAVPDAIQARYDLRLRVEALRRAPGSLDELIWTATALRQVEVALTRYRRVRSVQAGARLLVGDGISAAMRLTAQLTARLASGDQMPPVEALLRSAFALSVGRLRRDPTDAAAHYAMARVYLMTGDPGPAAASARAAARTAGNSVVRGDALTALAFARLAHGDADDARRAAELAVDGGVSTGHLVLAELAESEAGDAKDQAARSAGHRRSVGSDDLARYFGARPSPASVVGSVWQQQKQKTAVIADRVRDVVGARLDSLSHTARGDDDAR